MTQNRRHEGLLNNIGSHRTGQVFIQKHDFSPYMSNQQDKLDMTKHAIVTLPVIPEWIADLIQSGINTHSPIDATFKSIVMDGLAEGTYDKRFKQWCEEYFGFDAVTDRYEAGKQSVMQALSLGAYRTTPPERYRVRKTTAYMKQSQDAEHRRYLTIKRAALDDYRFVGEAGSSDEDFQDTMTEAKAKQWVKRLPLLELEIIQVNETWTA